MTICLANNLFIYIISHFWFNQIRQVAPTDSPGNTALVSSLPEAGITMQYTLGSLPRDNSLILNPTLSRFYSLRYLNQPQLESDLQVDYRKRFIFPNRQTLYLITFVLLSLSIFESVANMQSSYMLATWILRLVALAGACSLLLLTYRPATYTATRMQVLTSMCVVLIAAMQIQIDIFFNLVMEPYGINIILMLVSMVSSNLGLQFRYACVCSFTIIIMFTVMTLLEQATVEYASSSGLIFLWFGNILYMRSAFYSELYVRTDFILHVKQRDEEARVREFLDNMLPATVLNEIRVSSGKFIAHPRAAASVLFSDIKGFTSIASRIEAEEVVVLLNLVFSTFDALTTQVLLL